MLGAMNRPSREIDQYRLITQVKDQVVSLFATCCAVTSYH
jgi:hypothetical protein